MRRVTVCFPLVSHSLANPVVSKVLVRPGQAVYFDTPLCEFESEKATFEVASTHDGIVEKVHISEDQGAVEGDHLVTITLPISNDQGEIEGDLLVAVAMHQ